MPVVGTIHRVRRVVCFNVLYNECLQVGNCEHTMTIRTYTVTLHIDQSTDGERAYVELPEDGVRALGWNDTTILTCTTEETERRCTIEEDAEDAEEDGEDAEEY